MFINMSFGAEINKLKNASVEFKDNVLTLSTGKVVRKLKVTNAGLKTFFIGLINKDKSIREVVSLTPNDLSGSDFTVNATYWSKAYSSSFRESLKNNFTAKLLDIKTSIDDDNHFTTPHFKTVVEFEYSKSFILRYTAWTYPNATGFRSQISVKGMAVSLKKEINPISYCDAVTLPKSFDNFTKIGYYSDTQNRNSIEEEIVYKTKNINDKKYANLIIADNNKDLGLMLVKENSGCVNTPKVKIKFGKFLLINNDLLVNEGLGWRAKDLCLQHKEFRKCFASWLIVYQKECEANNLDDSRQLALKEFDRSRYVVNKKLDMYILANSWGSGNTYDQSKYASREENILKEIISQADLGIDVQQIDDGWQGWGYKNWRTVPQIVNKGRKEPKKTYDMYPQGWKNVKALAKEKNMRLGLWASNAIDGDSLFYNYQKGGFNYYKIDFAYLSTMPKLRALENKIRTFITKANHNVRVNWDVTEKNPRMGYFFGREYGNIFLANRKPNTPESVVYKPFLVLRDAWQISENLNLNKFQVTVQNGLDTNKKESDAYLYKQDYLTAIALMSSPLFFHLTQKYDDEQRDAVRALLKKYKGIRSNLYDCYTFPIGNKPDNKSYVGFQAVDVKNNYKTGYLLIFRERLNQESKKKIQLKFNGNKEQEYHFVNLMMGSSFSAKSDSANCIEFSIANGGQYLFLSYQKK
ncbi:hypothetical protein AAEX28_11600 [Lentisphaerota bacterium WC36G]|nr:hypothetical protein LJT99_14435 [Lentisphaerae bacterium WC36]